MKNQELIILGVLVVAIIYLVFFNQNGNEGFTLLSTPNIETSTNSIKTSTEPTEPMFEFVPNPTTATTTPVTTTTTTKPITTTTTTNKENLASYCDIHKNEGNCIQQCVDGQNCIEDTDYQLCKWSGGSCSENSRECLEYDPNNVFLKSEELENKIKSPKLEEKCEGKTFRGKKTCNYIEKYDYVKDTPNSGNYICIDKKFPGQDYSYDLGNKCRDITNNEKCNNTEGRCKYIDGNYCVPAAFEGYSSVLPRSFKTLYTPPRVNSTGANSTGANSTGANSTGANSAGANSTGANSTGANSTRANSTGANSTGANSTGYNSTGANSTGANSTGYNSTGANSMNSGNAVNAEDVVSEEEYYNTNNNGNNRNNRNNRNNGNNGNNSLSTGANLPTQYGSNGVSNGNNIPDPVVDKTTYNPANNSNNNSNNNNNSTTNILKHMPNKHSGVIAIQADYEGVGNIYIPMIHTS